MEFPADTATSASDSISSQTVSKKTSLGLKRTRSSTSMDLRVTSSTNEVKQLLSKFVRPSSSSSSPSSVAPRREDVSDHVLLEASEVSEVIGREHTIHPNGTFSDHVLLDASEINQREHIIHPKRTFSDHALLEASDINKRENIIHPKGSFSDPALLGPLEVSEINEQENINPCKPDLATHMTFNVSGISPENQQREDVLCPKPSTLEHNTRILPKFSISRHKPSSLTAKPGGLHASFRATVAEIRRHENGGNSEKCGTVTDINPAPSPSPSPQFYSVMYRARKKNAKNKGPWFDGILIVRGRKSTLLDVEGKAVCKGDVSGGKSLAVDSVIEISKYQIEVMRIASSEEYERGSIFTGSFDHSSQLVEGKTEEGRKINRMPGIHESKFAHKNGKFKGSHCLKRDHSQNFLQQSISEDALVLNQCYVTDALAPVVVDRYIATKLRPHQRDGVRFMYECVMGLRAPLFTGCLLADEMGLGKTLQVIALIWTLIHQKPAQGKKPFKHIIVVCPSSLVQNWGNEVKKWLGSERLKALVVHAGLQKEVEQKFVDFKIGKTHPLLITSYELIRKHQELIASSKPELLVCDEAHRLKNSSGNKTIASLLALTCPRRVLLTGTPVQNDLNEFYAMIDFANPNLLGPLSAFKRLYAEPIELSRDWDASTEQKQVGQARFLELQARTKFCILRRTAAVNKSYLPAKTEYLVFCRLQPLQVTLYESFVRSQFVTRLFVSESSSVNVLTAIGVLRKLCNHPKLVAADMSKEMIGLLEDHDLLKVSAINESSKCESLFGRHGGESVSGKLECVSTLLSVVFDPELGDRTERVVVVSNFTQTLNLVQSICEEKDWAWLRLDGSTLVADRQRLVDRFNSGFGGERVFLLSSKAGGMGLNLVGANRLILFDPDWNPATDAQAMARIWREGQQKPVIIYRLFSTGSIEEKIYQRQMLKGEIAATVEDNVENRMKCKGGRYFSREELRELFALNMETLCETHDLLCGRGLPVEEQWRDCSEQVEDPALRKAIQTGLVSFVQEKIHLHQQDS